MFDYKQDLEIILKTLDISSVDLCRELNFDMPTVSNWLNGKFEPDNRSKEDVYSFAYKKGLRLNLAYEQSLKNLGHKQGFECLYHGSKKGIKGEIDLIHSKEYNDLGTGFYLGETLEQSSMFVSSDNESHIYTYGLFLNDLNTYEYKLDTNWAITVSYNRGLLEEYSSSKKLNGILSKSKDADVIIAPIADNRIFEIIREFVNGSITDKACVYALSAFDLGKQYVLKSKKALDNLGFIKECYECKQEKKDYQRIRIEKQRDRQNAIRHFRSQNKNGKYIEDILWEKKTMIAH